MAKVGEIIANALFATSQVTLLTQAIGSMVFHLTLARNKPLPMLLVLMVLKHNLNLALLSKIHQVTKVVILKRNILS
jgi:hypothetical protein